MRCTVPSWLKRIARRSRPVSHTRAEAVLVEDQLLTWRIGRDPWFGAVMRGQAVHEDALRALYAWAFSDQGRTFELVAAEPGEVDLTARARHGDVDWTVALARQVRRRSLVWRPRGIADR